MVNRATLKLRTKWKGSLEMERKSRDEKEVYKWEDKKYIWHKTHIQNLCKEVLQNEYIKKTTQLNGALHGVPGWLCC